MSFGRGPTGLDDPQPLDVVGNDIQFIPVDAVALSVFVFFDQGGDALYYWAIAHPD